MPSLPNPFLIILDTVSNPKTKSELVPTVVGSVHVQDLPTMIGLPEKRSGHQTRVGPNSGPFDGVGLANATEEAIFVQGPYI